MAYGKVKANQIVYDTGAGDVTVEISSIPDTSSGIATTGEVSGGSLNTTGSISGNTLAITSGASAATFTGTAGNFVTATCDTGVFTYLSGTTTTGTTVNFTSGTVGSFYASTINKPTGAGTSLLITGDRVNAATGIFGTGTVTGLAATTIAAIEATDLTITATTGIYTLLSGATVTGGVFNGVSGNFGTLGVTGTASLTTISGNTVTGNNLHVTTTAQFASGVNVAATGTLGVYDGAGGYMRFKTPVALGQGNSQEFTTPSGDGTSGQLLATDGAGILYWKTDSAAPGSGEALTGVNLQSFSFVSGIHDTQGNVYSHVYATSGTFVSGLSSNSFTASTGTITGLATNNISAAEGGALTLTAATGTFTTGTITGLTSTNADIATGTLSTGTITGLAATTGTITSLFSSTGTITGLTSTTATATTFTYTTGNVEEAGVQNFRYPANENSTGLVSLSAGTSTGGTIAPSVTYYLPRTDGTSGYVLSTDAAGQLSWVDNGTVAANATLTGLNVVTNATANSLAANTGTFTSLTGTTTTGVTATFTTGVFTNTVSGSTVTGLFIYASQTVQASNGSTGASLTTAGLGIKNGKDLTIAVANVGNNFTLTLPGSAPTSGYILKASTGGVLEWAAESSIGNDATLTGLNVVTSETANSLAATTGTFTSLTGTTTVGTTAAFTTVSGATVTGGNIYATGTISGGTVYAESTISGGTVYATGTISGNSVSTAAVELTAEQLSIKQNATQGFQYPAAESSTGTVSLSVGTTTGGTVAPSVTYYLPRADGTSGYVLSTNAAGQLSWVDNGAIGDNATLSGLNVVTTQTANSLAATTGTFTSLTGTTTVGTTAAFTTVSGTTVTGSFVYASQTVQGGSASAFSQLSSTGVTIKNGKDFTIAVANVGGNFTLTFPGSSPTSGYILKASSGGALEWAAESTLGDNATLSGLNVVTTQTANSLAATTGTFTSLTGTTTVGTTAAFTTVSGATVTGGNIYATGIISGANVYATSTISGGTVSTASTELTPEQLLVKQNATQGFQYPADENSTGIISLSAGTTTGGTIAPSVTYYLPRADGTSGYVLSTNAAGQLSWVDNGAVGENATLTGLNVVTSQTANSLAATTGSFTTVTANTGVFTSSLSGTSITGGTIRGTSEVGAIGGPTLTPTGLKFTNAKNLTITVATVPSNFTLTLPGSTPTSGYILKASTGGVLQWAAESTIGDNATLTGLNVVTGQTINSLAATTGAFTTVTATTGVFTNTVSGSTVTGTFVYASNQISASNGSTAASLTTGGLGIKNGKDLTIAVASVSSNFTLQLPGSLPAFGTAVSTGNYALIATTGGVGQWVPQGRAAVKSGTVLIGNYALDVSGGCIQYITLSANTALTNTNFAEGDSVFLQVTNPGSQGSLYTLSYPEGTIFVGPDGNTAPTLTSGDYFLFWKLNSTFYASRVGGFA